MNEESKRCIDCLYCKVSGESTENCRLCFCAEAESKESHEEAYWLEKNVCLQFDDMNA